MKRNPLTLLTGGIIVVIFAMMLFAFQVRQTEVVVVTTFGEFSRTLDKPDLYFRLPWPIQDVHRFDNRIRNFERKYEQTTTKDGRILVIEVFLGWRITNPQMFLERFRGDVSMAELNLEGLLRDAKNGVVGRHSLNDFISTNPQELKFDQIEQEMLEAIQSKAATNYGIEVPNHLLGIKQIGLPEAITTKVFERMKAERGLLVKRLQGEGASEAIRIRSDADREREGILADAESKATIIRGQADAKVSESLKIFEQDPELAVFLLKLNALEQSLKERSTLVLDPRTPPFDLLKGQTGVPTVKP